MALLSIQMGCEAWFMSRRPVLGEPGKYPPKPISSPCHTQLTTPNQESLATRPSTCPHDSKFLLTVCITMVALDNNISSAKRVR